MHPTKHRCYDYDFAERDAQLRSLHSRLSLAKVQRNKTSERQLELAIAKVHRRF